MRNNFTHYGNANEQYQLVDFDAITTASGRRYQIAEGKSYPSVTTVVGFRDKEFFAEWRKNNPAESKRVLRRGNHLHARCERYLLNEGMEGWSHGDMNAYRLFTQMRPTIDTNIDNIYELEVALYSDTLEMAGRVDCIAEYGGILSVIDFKGATRSKCKGGIESYFLQCTAYAIMYEERTGIKIDQIVVLISSEDGEVQPFIECPDNYKKRLREIREEYREYAYSRRC